MALQMYGAVPRTSMVQSSSAYGAAAKQIGDYPQLVKRKERRLSMSIGVRASLDATAAAAAVAEVGQVTEVTKDTFWPFVEAADEKTVVVNMYTQC